SGDTLFNAGAGNCHNGGHPAELYQTFATQLEKLPDDTLLYPGHDYLVNNLKFTLDREPDNAAARRMLEEHGDQDPNRHVTTLGEGREITVLFRLRSSGVVERLRRAVPEIEKPEPKTVFLKLRQRRNAW